MCHNPYVRWWFDWPGGQVGQGEQHDGWVWLVTWRQCKTRAGGRICLYLFTLFAQQLLWKTCLLSCCNLLHPTLSLFHLFRFSLSRIPSFLNPNPFSLSATFLSPFISLSHSYLSLSPLCSSLYGETGHQCVTDLGLAKVKSPIAAVQ